MPSAFPLKIDVSSQRLKSNIRGCRITLSGLTLSRYIKTRLTLDDEQACSTSLLALSSISLRIRTLSINLVIGVGKNARAKASKIPIFRNWSFSSRALPVKRNSTEKIYRKKDPGTCVAPRFVTRRRQSSK